MITRHPVHRFSIGKGVIAPIVLLTTALASVAVGVPAAQATDGTSPVFGKWASTSFTTPQTHPGQPADPDGQTGEDNLANVKQIGERHELQIPATKHVSGWLRDAPEGNDWVQLPGTDGEKSVQDTEAYDQIVMDKEAWTETVEQDAAHWQRYSWTGGPVEEGVTPSFPSADWQPNVKGDPHDVGHAGAYFRSHGGAGNGDWFYLAWVGAVTRTIEHPATSHVVHHPAVAHQEFRYERVVAAHTEYYWSVDERTNTQTEPGVEEPATDPTTQPTIDPNTPPDPNVRNARSRTNSLVVSNAASVSSKSSRPNRPGVRSTAVPVSIDAGL